MAAEISPEEFKRGLAFLERTGNAIYPHIARCTVPFFAGQDQKPVPLGTGVLFRVAETYFVFSAAHVFDDVIRSKNNGLPIYTSSGAPGQKLIRVSKLYVFASRMPSSGYREDDYIDIGVAELDRGVVDALLPHARFVNIPDLDLDDRQAAKSRYFVMGYPVQNCDVDPDKKTLAFGPLFYGTAIYQTDRGDLKNHDPNVEIALEFVPERSYSTDGKPSVLPRPNGISGCGIWRLPKEGDNPDLWSVDSVKLVGLEHTWDKNAKVFRGTSIGFATKIIYTEYEHLRPVMDMSLGAFQQRA